MGQFVQKPIMKWVLEGDPVPVETRILQIVLMHKENPLHPTELLDMLGDHVPPYYDNDVRSSLSRMIADGELEFTADRKIILR